MNLKKNIKKFYRYIYIYGFRRTLIKTLSRIRPKIKIWFLLKFPFYHKNEIKIAIIGCGQHAYSSIAYFLTLYSNSRIVFVFDKNSYAAKSLAYAYNSINISESEIDSSILKHKPEIVYIASNHSTHTYYALKFLEYGCKVYIEKPIALNYEQLETLSKYGNNIKSHIFAGYNRPYSKSFEIIRNTLNQIDQITAAFFVTGHLLPENHWYRDPKEGSRIVANVGHWIDLIIHILYLKKNRPEFIDINITYSNEKTPSDNINISFVTNTKDLFIITFTSRGEPFEGVSEEINIQQSDNIIKVHDFRLTKVWKGSEFKKYHHWPKDNGHKDAVLEPFNNKLNREWDEINISTKLMLNIENMVNKLTNNDRFKL